MNYKDFGRQKTFVLGENSYDVFNLFAVLIKQFLSFFAFNSCIFPFYKHDDSKSNAFQEKNSSRAKDFSRG